MGLHGVLPHHIENVIILSFLVGACSLISLKYDSHISTHLVTSGNTQFSLGFNPSGNWVWPGRARYDHV